MSKKDAQPEDRQDKLAAICDHMAPPAIAFVGSDNDYGGQGLDHEQAPLAKVTPEITKAVTEMMNQKPDSFKEDE
jgi:hypothetical protein